MSSKVFAIKEVAHTGITVRSLDESLKFWRDLLGGEQISSRSLTMSTDRNIIGIPDAALSNVILQYPGGQKIELLEYTAPGGREVLKPRPIDVGSVHVAFQVQGSREILRTAEGLGWKGVGEPVKLEAPGGRARTFIYLFGPDGEAVELIEEVE